MLILISDIPVSLMMRVCHTATAFWINYYVKQYFAPFSCPPNQSAFWVFQALFSRCAKHTSGICSKSLPLRAGWGVRLSNRSATRLFSARGLRVYRRYSDTAFLHLISNQCRQLCCSLPILRRSRSGGAHPCQCQSAQRKKGHVLQRSRRQNRRQPLCNNLLRKWHYRAGHGYIETDSRIFLRISGVDMVHRHSHSLQPLFTMSSTGRIIRPLFFALSKARKRSYRNFVSLPGWESGRLSKQSVLSTTMSASVALEMTKRRAPRWTRDINSS